MAYKLTSQELPGLAKLAEECAEVAQDAAKIMGGCDSPEMFAHLQDEMGDVFAALRFFINHNPDVSVVEMANRADEKETRWNAKRAKKVARNG